MDVKNISSAYFIGIGGIGMSAIARYFNTKGISVSGYDKTATPLTRALEAEGIPVHYVEEPERIPKAVDLVVYTPAIPNDHQELSFYRSNSYPVYKRAEVLGLITKDQFTIAIAGSHGKTTVSTMISHLLRVGGVQCTAFLGGIALNYDSNFIQGDDSVFVVEADEYDRSFLQLNPDVAVITAVDTDHLDIYGSAENIHKAFIEFTMKIKSDGKAITHFDVPIKERIPSNVETYSLENSRADHYLGRYNIVDGSYRFMARIGGSSSEYVLNLGGRHNMENALAALVVANELDISPGSIGGGTKHIHWYMAKISKTG